MATGSDKDTPPYVEEDAAVGGKLPVTCDPCGRRKRTTPATVLCSTCDAHLCRECCEMHEIYVPGEHVFSSIQDGKDGHVIIDMHGLDRCAEHDRVFVYICKEHDCLCCEDCQFYQHKKCNDIHKIIEMAGGADVFLSDSKTELQGIISSGGDIIEECSVKLGKIEGRRNEIIREIDNKKMEMIRRFDDAKSCVEGELDAHDALDKRRLSGVKHETETLQTNVQELLTLTELVDTNGTDAEKFILNFECKKKTQHAVNKHAELKKNNYTENLKLDWNKHVLNNINTVDPIVCLHKAPPSVDTNICDVQEIAGLDISNDKSGIDKGINSYNSKNHPAPQATVKKVSNILAVQDTKTNRLHATVSPKPVRLSLVASLDLVKTGGDTHFPYVTGLSFLTDGRIVAVDTWNTKCFVLDASLKRQGSGFKFQSPIHDVTCMQNDNLAVTQGTTISIMSVSGDNTFTLLKTLFTSFNCGSISLLDGDTFILTTYNHERPVRTIDVHGNEGEFQHKLLPDKNFKLATSACAYIPSTKTLLFCGRKQNTVYMCDITSGEGHVIKSKEIVEPRGICAGQNGGSFVCSEDTHCVVQLSPTGDVLTSLRVNMKYPRAVSVSRDGSFMAVSNSMDPHSSIKLFNIEN